MNIIIWLVVGGAHRRFSAYVNGRLAAQHTGYPVSFRADITPYLLPESRQTVVIAVDTDTVALRRCAARRR